MRYRFIEAEKAQYPIRVLCHVLQVGPSGLYRRRRRPQSRRSQENPQLEHAIRMIHHRSRGNYAPTPASMRPCGTRASVVAGIAGLMRLAGLRAKTVRHFKQTTESRHPYPVAPNRLAR